MSFILTLSGKKFDYINSTIDDIDIEDIAGALSNICRFAGHLSEFYSVAQHSVLCSQLVEPEFAFEALMHDAAEAYCLDIPAPLKALLPDYRLIETRTDHLIRLKFGLPLDETYLVKYAADYARDRAPGSGYRRRLHMADSGRYSTHGFIRNSSFAPRPGLRPVH